MWLSSLWFPGGQCSNVCNNCSDQSQGGEELALVKMHLLIKNNAEKHYFIEL